jgi:hypothetical protein
MFEAYKIGVRIGIIDESSTGLMKIIAQMNRAEKAGQGLLGVLQRINAELGKARQSWAGNAADDFDQATRAAGRYEQAARRANGTASAGGSASPFLLGAMAGGAFRGGSGGSGGGPVPRIEWGGPGGGVPRLAGPSGGGGLAAGGSGSGGGGGGGGLGVNAWPSDFGAGRMGWMAQAAAAGRGGGGWQAMMKGFALWQGGDAALGMLHSPIEEAARYQQSQARFKQYGMSDALNNQAFALSKNLGVAGASWTDAMDAITEAQGVFRESGLSGDEALRGAKMAAPLLAKMSFAAGSLDDTTQAKMHHQELTALRFAEMRGGLKSPEAFNGIMDSAWKAIRSSGGNVDFEQYRQFMARGGVSAQGLSDRALYGELEPIIGELKGSTAGNALMTSYNRLTGAVRVPNQVAHMLADYGVWDASKVKWNSQGGIKSFNGNPLKDMSLMSSDPVQFYAQVIKPMYDKMGIKSQDQIARENTMIFGRTGGAMYSLIDRQYAQTQMSADAQAKTKGINGAVDDAGQTYAGNMKAFNAAWTDFKISFGNAALPILTKGLRIITPWLEKAAKFLGEHSALTTGLVVMLGAIGALAMVAAPILMIGGAFTTIAGVVVGGGLAAGLAGAAAGIVAIAGATAAAYELSDKYISGTKAGDWIGSAVAHTLAFAGNEEAKRAVADTDRANSIINGPAYGKPGGKNQPIQVHAAINLDGRKVGNAVSTHQANAAQGPQTGLSSFDTSQYGGPIGLNWGM